jgi:hypothetical protein
MNVKRILAKLRKERRAIDLAIAELEKASTPTAFVKKESTLISGEPGGDSHSPKSPDVGHGESRDGGRIIDFPPSKRAG